LKSYDHIILDHNCGEHQRKRQPACPICSFGQGRLATAHEENTPAGPVVGATEVGPRRHTRAMIERQPEDRGAE